LTDFKFSFRHRDSEIANIQRETEDNFAVKSDVNNKYDKVTNIITAVPKLIDMADGETKIYDDGTNLWRYYRAGSRLFKIQLTEV